MDAATCEGVPLHQYDFVLADPPYDKKAAERYGTKVPVSKKVMATLVFGLSSGAWVVWLDQREPMRRKGVWRCDGLIGLGGSTNHQYRGVAIFRRT